MTDDRSDDETSVLPIVVAPTPPRPAPIPAGPPAQPAPMPAVESPGQAYPPPAVMPPLYQPYRQPFPPTVGRVVFAGVVLLVFGVAGTVAGTTGAIFANALRRLFDQVLRDQGIRIEQGALINIVTGFFVVLLLLGVLHIVAASGVLSHRNWGRVLGILLCLLGVALSALLLLRVGQGPAAAPRAAVAALALLLPYGVSLPSLLFAGAHFGQRRRRR
jgi:hypothetical protein